MLKQKIYIVVVPKYKKYKPTYIGQKFALPRMIIQKGKSLTKIFYKIADDPHKYEMLSLCKNNLIHVPTIARLTDEVNSK